MFTEINATHDPALRSWVESANAPPTDFPIQNLPFGVFRAEGRARGGVALGDCIIDLSRLGEAGLLAWQLGVADPPGPPGVPAGAACVGTCDRLTGGVGGVCVRPGARRGVREAVGDARVLVGVAVLVLVAVRVTVVVDVAVCVSVSLGSCRAAASAASADASACGSATPGASSRPGGKARRPAGPTTPC